MTTHLEDLVERTKGGDRRAAEALVRAVQDDVYRLAFRMLGLRAEAEDASQEILLKALTHLSEFRGESSFRTWMWRIAVRHLLRVKKGRREEVASFETIEMLIARGDARPQPEDPEVPLLVEEVRLSCTQGMVMSLDREHRLSWVLAEVFDLSSEEAASVLEIEPAAHRKRLSRARQRLGQWMGEKCGLVSSTSACRCARQVPVAREFGVLDPGDLHYATHPAATRTKRTLPLMEERNEIEAAAFALRVHPDYRTPDDVLAKIRAVLDSGYRIFDT